MDSFLALWASLVGFGAVIGVVVNVLKAVGVVKDGQAQNWSVGLNLLGMAILLGLRVYVPDLDIPGADSSLQQLAAVLTVVFNYIMQLIGSKGAHNLLRGVPVVGKSYRS